MADGVSDGPSRPAGTTEPLAFFEAMAWPVPHSFAAAIAGMRFEQGDVLYRDRRSYDPLEKKMPKGLRAIQVLLPKRSTRGTSTEAAGDRRQSNWESEVTIEWLDLAAGRSETRVLTQGKLAMVLFTGDEAWLEARGDEPPLPLSARDLQSHLDQSTPAFDARQKAKRGSRFISVVDLASDASRAKVHAVEAALAADGPVERIDLTAKEAGIAEPARFHPSVVIRGLIVPDRDEETVLPILRSCLYGGANSSDEDADTEGASADRFSIGRHGLLEGLD